MECLMRRILSFVIAAGVCAGLVAVRPSAQEGTPGSSGGRNVVRISKYIISVADTQRSAAFYQGVFGIPFANGAKELPKLQPVPDLVQKLTSVLSNAMFRATLFAIPGAADDFIFEQTEFVGTPRPSSQPRMQDPGASFLVFNVRDLDAAM